MRGFAALQEVAEDARRFDEAYSPSARLTMEIPCSLSRLQKSSRSACVHIPFLHKTEKHFDGKVAIIHKKVSKNPVEGLETSTKTTYRAIKITPAQTLSILRSMLQNVVHFTLVFVVAATALRSSEVLSLRWADILWEERKIRIIKSWKKTGVDGSTKTPSSERDVPMGRVLAHYLREWHKQTPYAKPTDFVFPSIKESGRVPICASVFCADHLRPAAKKAGVVIPDGHRWGLHNLRHSLSNWLVNKAKEKPKTVQAILGHSRIQTTLDLYTDEDLDEMIAAQEKFLDAVGFE
jgi:integrase